jgi:hypothetical protein
VNFGLEGGSAAEPGALLPPLPSIFSSCILGPPLLLVAATNVRRMRLRLWLLVEAAGRAALVQLG